MPKRFKKTRIKKSLPWITSLALHLAALALLVLSDQPKEKGEITILNVELGGPVGAGHHSEMRKHVPRKKSPQIAPVANAAEETATESAPTGTAEQGTGDGGGNPGEANEYVTEVVRLINQAKRYPRLALLREEEGLVMVSVDVAADGTLSNPKIEKPSPYESLNQGALDTLKQIGKLPATPPSLHDGVHLHIPIQYRLNR